MTLITLGGLSAADAAMRDLMSDILDVTGVCGTEEDLLPTVANLRHAAVTLLEIADGWSKAADADALRSVLFHVGVITDGIDIIDIFPDGGHFCDHLSCDHPTGHGFCALITPANLRAAAAALMKIADVHDDAAA